MRYTNGSAELIADSADSRTTTALGKLGSRCFAVTCTILWLATAFSGNSQTPPAGQTAAQPPAASAPRAPLPPGLDPSNDRDPFASTYRPGPSAPIAITNATILTAAGPAIAGGTLLMADGRIVAVGTNVEIPAGTRVIDGTGRWLTPGIIDPHSHIGAMPSPPAAAGEAAPGPPGPFGMDGNLAALRIENNVWPQDPLFERALAAGVTSMQILPPSGHPFGGFSVVLKNVPATSVQAMRFPGAPYGMKMACGENPMGRFGGRAGLMLAFRNLLFNGADYNRRWNDFRARGGTGEPPRRDFAMENIAGLLRGEVLAHIHCYRADDMVNMIDLAHEFGFRISAFHHANEAFKIAPLLARERIGVATWAGDWSGYKMEAYDSIMETPGFIERAGGIVAMHSDDAELIQHLNVEAGRSMAASREAGLGTGPDEAIRWITLNPARLLGIDGQTGSLEAGKMADVVLWNGDPFSVYSAPDLVFIDGALLHDAATPRTTPRSDFELGLTQRPAPHATRPLPGN